MNESDKKPEYLYKEDEYPENCPICGSINVSVEDTDPNGSCESKEVYCYECGFEWTEYFYFRGWEPRND